MPADAVLCNCGSGRLGQAATPERPFYARDLEPVLFKRALEVCNRAKVRRGPLLDACTLDVAVTGDPAAARVFTGAAAPRVVGEVVRGEWVSPPRRK